MKWLQRSGASPYIEATLRNPPTSLKIPVLNGRRLSETSLYAFYIHRSLKYFSLNKAGKNSNDPNSIRMLFLFLFKRISFSTGGWDS